VLNFGWKSKDFCDIEEYWDTLIFRACFIWAWNESQSWYWSCCLIHSLANHCQLEKPHYEIFPKQSFNPTFSQVLEASLFSTCHFSSKSWNLIFSKKWKDLLCDTLHVFSCDSSVYVHCTHSQKGYTCMWSWWWWLRQRGTLPWSTPNKCISFFCHKTFWLPSPTSEFFFCRCTNVAWLAKGINGPPLMILHAFYRPKVSIALQRMQVVSILRCVIIVDECCSRLIALFYFPSLSFFLYAS